MTRVAVTSDIHYGITSMSAVEQLVSRISDLKPDVVALAGDLGEPVSNFSAVLDAFKKLTVPVAIVLGNHDVWNRNGAIPSRELWERRLPEEVENRGFAFLERESLLVDDVAIVGSIAWYDYSAAQVSEAHDAKEFIRRKPEFAGDALFVDWPWDDREFCRMVESPFVKRLEAAQRDSAVRSIVVVTHSPVFDEQILREPDNERWSFSNAYFGNLTLGEEIRGFEKVRHVVSGHTHAGREGIVQDGEREIRVTTLNSQYGEPAFVTVEL